MADRRTWPALELRAGRPGVDDLVSALVDDFAPAAIEDLTELPLPPGGLWDPTCPPAAEPPPAPLHWRIYFSTRESRDAAAAALGRVFSDLALTFHEIEDGDWAARSQRELRAVRAGAFVVAPPWNVPAPGSGLYVVVIEPSRGFGTGHHASTRLCLRALSGLDVGGCHVLDLGTGSGVLAMAAALAGARKATGIDVDPDAIESARSSARLNDLPASVHFLVGDFRTDDRLGPVDLVLANLTGGMLIAAATRIRELVVPGGLVILSGFDESERAAVRGAFCDLAERAAFAEEGWVALTLTSR